MSGNATVGNDLHDTVGQENVNEHSIVLSRVPDAELPENLCRPGPRGQVVPQLGQIQRRLDGEADLAGVARFGFAHRCFDGFEHL